MSSEVLYTIVSQTLLVKHDPRLQRRFPKPQPTLSAPSHDAANTYAVSERAPMNVNYYWAMAVIVHELTRRPAIPYPTHTGDGEPCKLVLEQYPELQPLCTHTAYRGNNYS